MNYTHEVCDLFKQIPKEKIVEIFKNSETAGAELDYTFLGFEEIYRIVRDYVPKDRIILDLGCGYAFQSWYFKEYPKYIGVDVLVTERDVLHTENSEYYFMSIQNFLKEIYPDILPDKEKVFAVCSYMPDDEARKLIEETFPHCLIYYPGEKGVCRIDPVDTGRFQIIKEKVISGSYYDTNIPEIEHEEQDTSYEERA